MGHSRRNKHEVTSMRREQAVTSPNLELALDYIEDFLDYRVDVVTGAKSRGCRKLQYRRSTARALAGGLIGYLGPPQRDRLTLAGLENDSFYWHDNPPSQSIERLREY